MYPGPAKVIHRPKTDADGSEIARIYGSEVEFPGRNCKRWMKELYEVISSCTSCFFIFIFFNLDYNKELYALK